MLCFGFFKILVGSVLTFQYQWYWNVTWRQWRQHLDPLCTHGHLNFQNYYIMHAPTMTCDIRIEHPPLLTKNPSELVVLPPLLTKNPRNLLLYLHSSQKPLGTCCYVPPLLTKNRSELVVIPPILTKTPRNLLLYPPPPPHKKTPELVVYMFSRLLSFTKGIRCHHLSHTDVIFLWRLSGGFYQNYRCFYDTVFLCMCICI